MPKIDDLKNEVVKGWAESPALNTCIRIIDYINALPKDELQMLTFTSLQHAAGEESVTDDLLRAVSLLANTSIHALDSKLLFIDDDEREFDVSKAELSVARLKGVFIHPDSGQPVPNFEKKIVPYFVPSDRFFEFKDH
jgi:hypothetical protein